VSRKQGQQVSHDMTCTVGYLSIIKSLADRICVPALKIIPLKTALLFSAVFVQRKQRTSDNFMDIFGEAGTVWVSYSWDAEFNSTSENNVFNGQ
jgi:hypothetical protein